MQPPAVNLWLQIELLCFIVLHLFGKSFSVSGLALQVDDDERCNNQLFNDELLAAAETLRGSNFRMHAFNVILLVLFMCVPEA